MSEASEIAEFYRKEGGVKALVWAMNEALRLIEDMRDHHYSGCEGFAAAKLVQLLERLQDRIGEIAAGVEKNRGDRPPGVTIVIDEVGPPLSPETMREVARLLNEAGQVHSFGGRRSGRSSEMRRKANLLREAGLDARIVRPTGAPELRGHFPAHLRRLLDSWRRFFSRGLE